MSSIIDIIKDSDMADVDKQVLIESIKEYEEAIKYYSQNFVGAWNSTEVNVNWRALKCTNKIKEIKGE